MFLVAGLGNPGPKYAGNRHNLGFMVVERLAERHGAAPYKEKWKGRFTKVTIGGADVVLLEPLTFMNLSGDSVQPAMAFFRVEPGRVEAFLDAQELVFEPGASDVIELTGNPEEPPLEISTFSMTAAVREIRLKRLDGAG